MTTLSKISNFVLDLFFPARCALWDRIVKYDECVCKDCLSKIIYYDNYCRACGFTDCRCESKPGYDKALCMGIYDGVLKEGILRLKTKMSQQMCRFFADWVKHLPESDGVDVVTFVPMTKQRYRESGFNHAKALAKYVSIAIDKPLVVNALVKTKIIHITSFPQMSAENVLRTHISAQAVKMYLVKQLCLSMIL